MVQCCLGLGIFNVTILFCIWLNRFVILYHCFVRYMIILCIVMLFCDDATLNYRFLYYGVSYYDDDKEMVVIVPVLQKGQETLDFLVDDDDKEKIVLVPVLQNPISQPPSPTTSIVPKLLPPPSTHRNFLISQPPLPTFAREPLQSPEGGFIVLTDSPTASAL